jgi:hypothetical protein
MIGSVYSTSLRSQREFFPSNQRSCRPKTGAFPVLVLATQYVNSFRPSRGFAR